MRQAKSNELPDALQPKHWKMLRLRFTDKLAVRGVLSFRGG